jgi:N-methylhydantoinase A
MEFAKAYKLGIDIGGTFTDLVLAHSLTGRLTFGKTLTTYPDPTLGILKGVAEILEKAQVGIHEIETLVHGTTLVTNAVIERKGAKTALITTQGFEDVLEIGREMRYDIYDLFITMPKPLVPRNLRFGLEERVGKNGEVVTPLNKSQLEGIVTDLKTAGVESVAVCFLHAFANSDHEKIVGAVLEKQGFYVSLSSEVMPEIREYERSSATTMNAYVQPITDEYLKNLGQRLRQLGFMGVIHIMISSGRLTTIEGARKIPIQLLESGPAGGTMAGVFFGRLMGKPNLLAFDMGGTTAKASLIRNLEPEITNHFEAAREKRFKKGSGLPVRIPVIDMIEIGAGGGSIAHINALGLLTVGPESAASEPGPACYARGGTQPTVTDADLFLGFLNEDFFLGGTMSLNKQLAADALSEKIAKPADITLAQAAWGIHRLVNENMANAARVHILEKGLDPRSFSMLAFGGAGPVHAFGVARLLGARELIIPIGAGVISALGFLVSPIASEKIVSHVAVLKKMDWEKVNLFIQNMEAEGFDFLQNAHVPRQEGTVTRLCDMRFKGQGHEITVKLPNNQLSSADLPTIEARFKEEYILRFGRFIENMEIETVTWRTLVSGKVSHLEPVQNIETGLGDALKGTRLVFDSEAFVETPVYDRYKLETNASFEGPAIIEEVESTFVVGKNATVRIDALKNIVVTLH